jgi:hypothetical protein
LGLVFRMSEGEVGDVEEILVEDGENAEVGFQAAEATPKHIIITNRCI